MNHQPRITFELKTWLTPLSILLGSIIVSLSILSLDRAPSPASVATTTDALLAPKQSLRDIRPLLTTDHVLGNRNAEVVFIEYSDTECPFCKTYHENMHRFIKDYGDKTAWVYRHNPLPIHPKAQKEAEATECAAELGGEKAFWTYIDRLFSITPSNDRLDPAELPKIASFVGLDEKAFNECLASGRHAARIAADKKEIDATGQTGTPSTVVISKDGNIGFRGNASYEKLVTALNAALGE